MRVLTRILKLNLPHQRDHPSLVSLKNKVIQNCTFLYFIICGHLLGYLAIYPAYNTQLLRLNTSPPKIYKRQGKYYTQKILVLVSLLYSLFYFKTGGRASCYGTTRPWYNGSTPGLK
jgi:hypothetical protein